MYHKYTVSLTCLLLLALSSAVAQERVYWTNAQNTNAEKIQRSDLDGGHVENLVTGLVTPRGIALDMTNGKMYWTDPDARRINRANLDGSDVEDLVTGTGAVGIALDIAAGKMYWTDNNSLKINRANLDGSEEETLVEGGAGFRAIALDVTGGRMYYHQDFPGDGQVPLSQLRRANLDGTNQETVLDGQYGQWGSFIALDVAAGKMYWSHSGSGIHRANLDGSDEETVWQRSLTGTRGIALDVAAGKMYWTTRSGESERAIVRANLDGSNFEDLVVITGTGLLAEFRGIALDVTGGKMYWVYEFPKVQRANLDGTNVEDLIVNQVVAPEGLALDFAAGKMYWTDAGSQRIRRADLDGANLDGTSVEDLVDTGLTGPRGLALDVNNEKIYWTEEFADRIRRADLDGGNEEDVVTGLDKPYGIALHVPAGKMYWTDSGALKIQRADLDGSDMEDLVSTNLVEPRGIALDLFGNKIYWTDSSTGKIQRANLDGSNVEDHLTEQGGGIWGIALDVPGNKMYWTWRWDEVIMAVRRADLDGSNVQDVAVLDLSSSPGGIALELEASDLSVSPAGIDFGAVPTDTARDTTFTLTNTSTDTLRITGVTTTDSVFTTVDTTLILAPGDTAALSVAFAPTGRGSVNAQVVLTSDALSSPHVVGVQGEGRTVQTMAITADTSTVVYQDANGTTAAVTFTDGQVTGHTLTVETFGNAPPSSVQSVPPFSNPVFYVGFNTTIPDSLSFQATVTFTYTDAQLDSAGITQEDSLKVAWYNETTEVWSTVTGVLDAANNTVTFTTDHFSVFALAMITPTGIGDGPRASLPFDFILHAARPNPFNPSTTILYEVSHPAHVTLMVYNILGQGVIRLVDGQKAAGRYSAFWHGRNAQGQAVASGIYVYRMTAGDFAETKRMTLLK